MSYSSTLALLITVSSIAASAAAQAPPNLPPWDVEISGSFVGTHGNSDTTTLGANAKLHRRWPVWQIEATADAVRTSDAGARTVERYVGTFRTRRTITPAIGFTAGERTESDRLAGIDLRSVLDAGLSYAILTERRWTLDALSSVAWSHETSTIIVPNRNDPTGLLQIHSDILFSPTANVSERLTYYPDFSNSSAYRAEAEVIAQAAMNSRLALKVGYLWRFSNAPVAGFVKNDNTATASVVIRWKGMTPAPPPQ
jgi:putative salt-induced outer membrane protein YdiY